MPKKDAPNVPGMAKKKAPEEKVKPAGLPQPVEDEEIFEEDFTDIDDSGYPMVAEGYHHAKVIEFERGESKGGNPQYIWQFTVIAGDSKGVDIRFWTSLLPKAKWKASESLEAIGVEVEGTVARFGRSEIVGKPCIIEVYHDVYQGKTNHKVEKVHPPTEDTLKFMEMEADTPF